MSKRWRRRRRDVRVLGVDPGTRATGYGVIETDNGASGMGRLIECGVITFTRQSPLPRRLHELHAHIADLITRHRPTALALENAFYHKNVQTTLVLGHARGVILLAAEQAGLAIAHHAPAPAEKTVAGETVSLATELVVREDGWALYGFRDESERRFFQRLIGVTGIGPKLAIALMSALGVERGARALQERNIALLSSVSGIGKKTAERLALELADKLREFEEPGAGSVAAAPRDGIAEAALKALERLGYGTAEADRALRDVLAADGGGSTETLVRRALHLLTGG